MISTYQLKEKIQLTHDVFELHFEKIDGDKLLPMHGQFITFLVPNIGGRAYSVLKSDGIHYVLIIKRVADGRGGSIAICDMQINETIKGVGPTGHFVLKESHNNKLFLGTGTGFVPLYSQAMGALEKNLEANFHFAFGVRTHNDMFYYKELTEISEKHKNFTFDIFLSQDAIPGTIHGRNTDFLTEENIKQYDEFYICGAPPMMESAISILKSNGIKDEQIHTEKY